MELKNGKKIEFDLEEFVPLLLSNKQEGFRLIGERYSIQTISTTKVVFF